jgi:archaetidylinositol phosphate synthase
VLKSRFGADSDQVVHRILPFLSRVQISPDTLTLIGVLFSAAAGLVFGAGEPFAAAFLLGIAGACDLLDGVIARAQGSSTVAGGFLDSSMDRLSDLLILGGITFGMAAAADLGGVALALWAIAASVMTSYTRARAERHLERFDVGVMERGERFVVLILGALSGFLVAALWIIAIGATWTTIQRLLAARRLLAELARTGQDPTAMARAEPEAANPKVGARRGA